MRDAQKHFCFFCWHSAKLLFCNWSKLIVAKLTFCKLSTLKQLASKKRCDDHIFAKYKKTNVKKATKIKFFSQKIFFCVTQKMFWVLSTNDSCQRKMTFSVFCEMIYEDKHRLLCATASNVFRDLRERLLQCTETFCEVSKKHSVREMLLQAISPVAFRRKDWHWRIANRIIEVEMYH